jgi:ubiquinone/menaquinone biosynthesis C-methylase UbiE
VDFAGLLDAGSGTGSPAFAIVERRLQAHVVGIDPFKEYVAYPNGKNPFPDRAGFQVGDAQQLPFPNTNFDAALSLRVFNFIPDPPKALLELRRITKPGGNSQPPFGTTEPACGSLRMFWDAAVSMDPAAEKLDEKPDAALPCMRVVDSLEVGRSGECPRAANKYRHTI